LYKLSSYVGIWISHRDFHCQLHGSV